MPRARICPNCHRILTADLTQCPYCRAVLDLTVPDAAPARPCGH